MTEPTTPTIHARDLACSSATRELPRDATLKFQPERQRGCVTALHGTLLVTQAGDPDDHVLVKGESFRAAPRGLVVVWALSDAAVQLSARSLRYRPSSAAVLTSDAA